MQQRPGQKEKILRKASNTVNNQKILQKKQPNTGDINNDEEWYENKEW
jgi:hypothetical protein